MAFALPGANLTLTSFFDIWGNLFLWSVIATFLVYLVVGCLWVTLLRVGQKKQANVAAAGVFFLSAVWKMISNDIIICALVAGIYVTLEEEMAGHYALLWGVGLSVAAVIVNTLIACFPIYSIL